MNEKNFTDLLKEERLKRGNGKMKKKAKLKKNDANNSLNEQSVLRLNLLCVSTAGFSSSSRFPCWSRKVRISLSIPLPNVS